MSRPRILFVLRNNACLEAAGLPQKENMPETPLSVESGQVAGFKVNK